MVNLSIRRIILINKCSSKVSKIIFKTHRNNEETKLNNSFSKQTLKCINNYTCIIT